MSTSASSDPTPPHPARGTAEGSGRLTGPPLRVYRTMPARLMGWVLVVGAGVLAALTVVDVVAGHRAGLLPPVALVVGLGALGWVLFLRPSVRLHEDGVVLGNLVTDTTVPFAAVEEVTHQWALELVDRQGRRHSAWAVPVKRERVRRQAVDDFAETTVRRRGDAGTTAQGVADEVQRALQRWRLDGGELAPDGGGDLAPGGKDPVPPVAPVQRPAWGAVVVLAVAVALVVLALLA
ncbi:hypothetical protein [Ornithinimicrobium kibberense]|uniref:PH (Pleckstrin Homology) domain-containing protein n=1 Tax=Ornithinimicrobium kibberense TaxID=282060 RepID=A0ABV5V021_9MICO|nr:hypothetical protein [Ornithinimicrobium kibberense]